MPLASPTTMWIRTVLIFERVLIIILSLEAHCDLAVSKFVSVPRSKNKISFQE